MSGCGVAADAQAALWKTLAAVMLIASTDMHEGGCSMDSACRRHPSCWWLQVLTRYDAAVEVAARLLSVPAEALKTAMTTHTMLEGGKSYNVAFAKASEVGPFFARTSLSRLTHALPSGNRGS
jgi:hypothetical protein